MIKQDQPIGFSNDLIVAVSSKQDGTILNRLVGTHNDKIVANRYKLCAEVGLSYEDFVYQRIAYDDNQSYNRVVEVYDSDTAKHKPEVKGDALFTRQAGVGLFLPIADCLAMVIYDPMKRYLALAHNGRHSSYAKLTTYTIKHFIEQGSVPGDILVWMSPHAQKSTYSLDEFDRQDEPDWQGFYERRDSKYYLDLAGFNRNLLIKAGIATDNITISQVDTVTSKDYFSHSTGDIGGRFAVMAMMK